jgi:hypothetical protein
MLFIGDKQAKLTQGFEAKMHQLCSKYSPILNNSGLHVTSCKSDMNVDQSGNVTIGLTYFFEYTKQQSQNVVIFVSDTNPNHNPSNNQVF